MPAPKDRITSDPALRKKILIVDDINDSGATINWIVNDWPSGCLPNDPAWDDIWNNTVRFATVVDNQSSKSKVIMDYAGMTINKAEKDVWIEFPYEEWWTK
jgi:hypoxanthine phosphoribosyltransferase